MRLSGNTDCHTSDIGHWFAMTETDFVYGLTTPEADASGVVSYGCVFQLTVTVASALVLVMPVASVMTQR